MLHIIIFILKIIGILLLVILGLILPLAGKFRVVCTDHLQSQGRTQGWSDPGTSSCRLDVSAAFSALQASYRSGTYAAITGADLWDTRVETAGAKEREAEEG